MNVPLPNRQTHPLRAAIPVAGGPVAFDWAVRTDVGKGRTTNEDSFLVREGVYAVADGMGGHAAGDVASATLVAILDSNDLSVPIPVNALTDLVDRANSEVWQLARDTRQGAMGTTLVAALWTEREGQGSMVVVNIGDSRCYIVDDAGFRTVTHDHSVVQALVDAGEIDPAEASTHPDRNVVTRAIGIEPAVTADFVVLMPSEVCRLLLCSDGVSNELEAGAIERAMCLNDRPADVVDELMEGVLGGDAPDNATALVVDISWDGTSIDDSAATGPRHKSSSSSRATGETGRQIINEVPK